MRKMIGLLAACALSCVASLFAAEQPTVPIAAPAAWVETLPLPELSPTPADDTSYGYDYFLIDRQTNVAAQSTYYRNVYRLTAESSLQDGARFTWSYDPAYEQLTLHHLHVRRGAEVQDRLKDAEVKIIQQERELERHMLNGELTALVILGDIRVGDVIDYAFTRTGWNPTFHGRYFGNVSAQWSVPVRHQHVALLASEGHVLRKKAHGELSASFVSSVREGVPVETWDLYNLRPLHGEGETPDWFNRYPFLQISEFSTWGEVVRWAEPLYAVADPLPAAVREKAEALTAGLTDPDAKAVALLQFVQQEIRYLGMELGAGSYRPSPPGDVLARRFGDCKDKALLFCTLMRAVGLEAYPALLHTDYVRTIVDWLPSPHAFDHVIACVPKGDDYAWVDPTLTDQAGGLDYRALPEYGRALVLRPGNDQLSAVHAGKKAASTVRVEERFEVKAFDQPATFTVTSHFTGRRADTMRRYLRQTALEEVTKSYVNFYASNYAGLTSVKPVSWTDEAAENRITLVETYAVAELWKEDTATRKLEAEFYPRTFADYVVRPKTPVRTTPLELGYPLDVKMTTTVNLPEEWSINARTDVVDDPAFHATRAITGEGKVVTMSYSWENRVDHVAADQVASYVKALAQYRDALGHTLTYTKPAPAPAVVAPPPLARPEPGFNWKLALFTLVVAGAVGYFALGFLHHEPVEVAVSETDRHLAGLGGWLILIGFGVTLRPFAMLWRTWTPFHGYFDQATWDAVALVGGANYRPGLALLLAVELAGNIAQIVWAALVLVLFYRRQQLFPRAFIIMAAFGAGFIALDRVLAASFVADASKQDLAVLGTLVQAAVWIPYMIYSRRVRATFTR